MFNKLFNKLTRKRSVGRENGIEAVCIPTVVLRTMEVRDFRTGKGSIVEALRRKHDAGTAFDFTPFYQGEGNADDYSMSSSYEFSRDKLNITIHIEDTDEIRETLISDWVWYSVVDHMIHDTLTQEDAEQLAVEDNQAWEVERPQQFLERADLVGMATEIIEELAPAFIGEEFIVGSDEWVEAFDDICNRLYHCLHIGFKFSVSEPFTADMYLEQWENRLPAVEYSPAQRFSSEATAALNDILRLGRSRSTFDS